MVEEVDGDGMMSKYCCGFSREGKEGFHGYESILSGLDL